jgi:DNA polymerase-3 subunit epsilon
VRYGIDNSRRTKHGALLDAELLAEVYAELAGGRQALLGLVKETVAAAAAAAASASKMRPMALPERLTEGERLAHRTAVASLGADAIWRDYLPDQEAEPVRR